MAINITQEGEIIVQGDHLRQRLTWAQKINSTLEWMRRRDLWAVLRGNQTYGGVLFHREVSYEEGVERPKRIGYVLTPDNEVVVEELDSFDQTTGKFESIVMGEFPPILLTARTGPHPQAPLYFWLPPNLANEEKDKEKKIQSLINMVHSIDQEAKTAKAEHHNALRELNSLRRRYRDEERINEELRYRLDALEPEIVALRHRVEAMNVQRARDEATLEEVLKQAEEDGRFRGKHGLEFAREVLQEILRVGQMARNAVSGMTNEQISRRLDLLQESIHVKPSEKKEKGQSQEEETGGIERVTTGA